MTHLAVVDYGMGNRRSVQKALEHVGARATITREPAELKAADGVILPGVGAFPQAMRNLRQLELTALLSELPSDGVPLLGICLGMQLLFDRSNELEPAAGLRLIAGEVRPVASGGRRVPHIGWNDVRFERTAALTVGLPAAGCPFYHVHSFAVHPSSAADIVATTEYGERFATIVEHGTVYGAQFHPEKSSAHGLQLLANFVGICSRRRLAEHQPARAAARG